ncbi:MAG TPA: hypothetical protein VF728_09175 [Nocardioides sp.]
MISHRVTGTSRSDRLSLLGAMARADAERTVLVLDLTALDEGNPSKRRLTGWWVATVSNLLLGRFADLRVRVRHAESNSIQAALLRGGFYFALAQRPGVTEHPNARAVTRALVDASVGDWSPRSGPVLFAEAPADRQAERTYLYANVQRKAEPGYFRHYQGSAAFPWLGDVVPRPTGSLGGTVHDLFVSAVADTLCEVLDNVPTHAFNLRQPTFAAGWLGSGIVERARSCFLVSVTEGGTGSFDRLHVLALDNGFSIPRTLRWQHPLALRHDHPAALMERVLQHRLTGRGIEGHSGAGLWFLFGLARFAGGTISLISEDDQSDGRSGSRVEVQVPPEESPAHSTWTHTDVDAPVRGTIVHLQMQVPKLRHDNADELRRRVDDFHRFRSSWLEMA